MLEKAHMLFQSVKNGDSWQLFCLSAGGKRRLLEHQKAYRVGVTRVVANYDETGISLELGLSAERSEECRLTNVGRFEIGYYSQKRGDTWCQYGVQEQPQWLTSLFGDLPIYPHRVKKVPRSEVPTPSDSVTDVDLYWYGHPFGKGNWKVSTNGDWAILVAQTSCDIEERVHKILIADDIDDDCHSGLRLAVFQALTSPEADVELMRCWNTDLTMTLDWVRKRFSPIEPGEMPTFPCYVSRFMSAESSESGVFHADVFPTDERHRRPENGALLEFLVRRWGYEAFLELYADEDLKTWNGICATEDVAGAVQFLTSTRFGCVSLVSPDGASIGYIDRYSEHDMSDLRTVVSESRSQARVNPIVRRLLALPGCLDLLHEEAPQVNLAAVQDEVVATQTESGWKLWDTKGGQAIEDQAEWVKLSPKQKQELSESLRCLTDDGAKLQGQKPNIDQDFEACLLTVDSAACHFGQADCLAASQGRQCLLDLPADGERRYFLFVSKAESKFGYQIWGVSATRDDSGITFEPLNNDMTYSTTGYLGSSRYLTERRATLSLVC